MVGVELGAWRPAAELTFWLGFLVMDGQQPGCVKTWNSLCACVCEREGEGEIRVSMGLIDWNKANLTNVSTLSETEKFLQ